MTTIVIIIRLVNIVGRLRTFNKDRSPNYSLAEQCTLLFHDSTLILKKMIGHKITTRISLLEVRIMYKCDKFNKKYVSKN